MERQPLLPPPTGGDEYLLELCAEAAKLLKQSGFVLHWASMKSEACYYRFAERGALLRVSTHKGGDGPIGIGLPVVSNVTFCDPRFRTHHMETTMAAAIGRYMMKSLEPRALARIRAYKPKSRSVDGELPAASNPRLGATGQVATADETTGPSNPARDD